MKYKTEIVLAYWRQCGIDGDIVPEHRFHPERKWRIDFAVLAHGKKVAVEINGAIWTCGRHSRGSGLVKEYEKLRALAQAGWLYFPCTPDQVCTLDMVNELKRTLS